jgi:general secretion pathway protein N
LIYRKRGLVLVAVVTLVVGLIALFPARVAYRWGSTPLIAMSGIQGTIWSGTASQFSTNGVYLGNLSWKMQPLKLFTGKASYKISGTPVSGSFDAHISIGLGGKVILQDVVAFLPLQMLERAANVPGLRGNAALQFERMELVGGRPAALDGSINVADVVVPMLSRSSLGGYRAEFFTQNNGIIASVEDTDGVVDLAGRLEVRVDGSYAFLGKIKAKPNTPDSIASQLKYLPPADADGQHELRLEGTY